MLTAGQIRQYDTSGFLLIKNLFDQEEIELLQRTAKEDKELDQHSFGREDGEGGTVRLSLWNHPGHGIYGAFARCNRITAVAEALLRDEPYHYHSKMIMKDAQIGGAWTWHQDYGYWYRNGVLKPDLLSAFIAVDPCTQENGCLQVIEGSHHCGRIEHVLTGDQAGADTERVQAIVQRMPHLHMEMNSGDVLFFHANLLHRSDQNRSNLPRWSMICCYNAKENTPYFESHHPSYTPLQKIDDSQVKIIGKQRFDSPTGQPASNTSFLDPSRDNSAKTLPES